MLSVMMQYQVKIHFKATGYIKNLVHFKFFPYVWQDQSYNVSLMEDTLSQYLLNIKGMV